MITPKFLFGTQVMSSGTRNGINDGTHHCVTVLASHARCHSFSDNVL